MVAIRPDQVAGGGVIPVAIFCGFDEEHRGYLRKGNATKYPLDVDWNNGYDRDKPH